MNVKVERDRCMGSGACVFEAPEVFDQDDEGIVVLLTEKPEQSVLDKARAAAEVCPVACISVDE